MRNQHFLFLAGIAGLLAIPLLPLSPSWVTTLSYIGVYAVAVLGLVLLTGTAGMLSFGQAAFMGVGAYVSALAAQQYGISPWLGLLVGWAITGLSAWILGAVTLPMSGHYLPIATLAWGLALTIGFANMDVLGRNDGMSGIPPLSIGALSLQSQTSMYYVVWGVVLLAMVLVRNLLDSRPGRAIRALIGGGTMPEAMGIDTVGSKRTAFVVAALLASTAGWLYAHMLRAISPSAFGPHYSLELVFMAVIGGASSIGGALLGSGIVILAKDSLQTFLPRLMPVSGSFESVFLGIAMVILLIKTRTGAWPYLKRMLMMTGPTVRIPAGRSHEESGPRAGGRASVQGIVKRFGGLVAVNKVTLEVDSGQIVALIGPNGAGKSTTFNLITGVLSATEGKVTFNGEDITSLTSRQIASKGIYRTFQHVKLVPSMSVVENIAIGAHLPGRGSALRSMLRLDRREETRILRDAAEQGRRVGLGEFLFAEAGSLSLGQQRLVEIARALAGRPSLLLLDEPAAGLRFAEKTALAKLLRELRADGVSVLLVEHDMQFVMELVDKIFVLDFGTPIADGVPKEIQQSEAVRRAYLGVEQ